MALPDLPAVGSFFGVLGLLGFLIVHFMRQASADRRDYRTELRDQQKDHEQEMDSARARYEREIAYLSEQLDHARERLAESRRARRMAEDQLERYRRLVGDVDEPPVAP